MLDARDFALHDPTTILALRRCGPETDALLARTARRLARGGVRLAGVLQEKPARDGRRRCDLDLFDLADGRTVRISEDRGDLARGCRLSWSVMAEVALWVERAIEGGADILILNKFGKAEIEGRGLRDALAAALFAGVPVLTGVDPVNEAAFVDFTGGLGRVTDPDEVALETWLDRVLDRARPLAAAE